MDERIVRFIRRHHVLTLATVSADGAPWCCNLFYAVVEGALVFSSSAQTAHATHFAANPVVGASIVLESRVVGKLQGVQLTGTVAAADENQRRAYLKRFPYALLIAGEMWAMRIESAKYTDNTLGFGTKLYFDL